MCRWPLDDRPWLTGHTARIVTIMSLVTMTYSAARPLATYRAIDLDASALQIGIIAATFAAGPLLFAVMVGRLVDRLGPRPVIVIATLLSVPGFGAAAAAPNLALLALGTAIIGIAHVSALISLQTSTAYGRSGMGLDRAYGFLTAGGSAGQALGPGLALGLASLLSIGTLTIGAVGLLICVIVSASAATISLLGHDKRHPTGHEHGSRTATPVVLSSIWRSQGVAPSLVASAVVLSVLDLLLAYLPLWASERGMSPGAVGALLAIRGIVMFLSRVLLVHLLRAVGRLVALVGSMILAAVGMALLPMANIILASVLMVALGIGLGLAQPLTLAWVTSVVQPGAVGAALGLRMLCNRATQATLPLGLAAASRDSSAGIFFASAALLLLSSLTVSLSTARGKHSST